MSTATTTGLLWRAKIDDAPVALTSAGGRVAVGGADGTAVILDAADGRATATATLAGGLLDLAFSPDGEHLTLTGPLGHLLCTAAGNHQIAGDTMRWSARARWSGPERVAIADGRTAVVLDTDGRELWRTAAAPSTVTDLAWLRDGRRLALTAYNGVRCHERHRPEPVTVYKYAGSHLSITVSPNGRWICTGNQDASIHIWRTRDAVELTMSGYPGKVSRLAFDDTGRWLASDGSPEITVWDFAGKGPHGGKPRMLRAHDAVTALAWRPGNTATLATGGTEGTVAVWNAAGGVPGRSRTTRTRWELHDEVTALAWSTRDTLVAATRDGTVHHLAPGT